MFQRTMLVFALFVLAIAASSASAALTLTAGQNNFTMVRPEGTRTYYVWVPHAYLSGTTAVPLVFHFHGMNGDAVAFLNQTGFATVANANNFLIVYPQGWVGTVGDTGFNAGACCFVYVDDIGFTLALVSWMQANFRINPREIMSVGFSNGAMMTQTLLCQESSIFAAGFAVSGTTVYSSGNIIGLSQCDTAFAANNHSSSLYLVHGTSDSYVPWLGDAFMGMNPIVQDFNRWGARIGCQGNPVNDPTVAAGPYSGAVYRACPGGATVELVTNNGGAHIWPIDQYFNATKVAWQFLSNIITAHP